MSPLQIEILLQHHYSPRGYTGYSVGSPAHKEAMGQFVLRGLLVPNYGGHGSYELTDKGQDTVQRLLAVPMEVGE